MTNVITDVPFGQAEILSATREEMPVVANLFELYAHDFSEFHPVEPGPDGLFGYPALQLYWSEPERYPFLIRVGGKLAGFILVHRISQTSLSDAVWDMAEFFVLRANRRCGVGKEAAHLIWRRFPGAWQIRVMDSNRAAYSFWQSAIAEFLGKAVSSVRIEKSGDTWNVFSFDPSS